MRIVTTLIVGIAIGVVIGGCQSSKPAVSESRAGLDLKYDPCAERLHEISGLLLQYYALYRKLPANLDDLRSLETGDTKLTMSCPVSGKPYIYNPKGLAVTSTGSTRMIVYDPTPVHDGMRWAIAVSEPVGEGPLSTSVRAIPESAIPKEADKD